MLESSYYLGVGESEKGGKHKMISNDKIISTDFLAEEVAKLYSDDGMATDIEQHIIDEFEQLWSFGKQKLLKLQEFYSPMYLDGLEEREKRNKLIKDISKVDMAEACARIGYIRGLALLGITERIS